MTAGDENGLGTDEVHIWWAQRRNVPTRHLTLLDASEWSRLEALRRPDDRDRFVTGCALLRATVARYRGVDPADVEVERTCGRCGRPHGKPRVPGSDGLEVSITHSGELVGVAVARGAAVGLDVEELELSADDLPLPLALTDREAAWHRELPEGERTSAFLTVWTRKEAVLKATGEGLLVPLTDFSVAPAGEPGRVVDWPTRPDLPGRLRLYDLRPGERQVATLAVLDPSPRTIRELDGRALLRAAAAVPG